MADHNAKTGGYVHGPSHAQGGVKGVNKDTGQPLEVEGGEIVINKRSVSDTKTREFEGKQMTNKQILSKINQDGGGVAFGEGGEVHKCACGCETHKKLVNDLNQEYMPRTNKKYGDGGDISKKIDYELENRGFVYNKHNYRYGFKVDEDTYISGFYDKNKNQYSLRGTKKFSTPLGGNSAGINFDFENETDFFNKIEEYVPRKQYAKGGQIKQTIRLGKKNTEYKYVGKNSEGQAIYENENGYRAKDEGNSIFSQEPVLIYPTASGVGYDKQKDRGQDYEVVPEVQSYELSGEQVVTALRGANKASMSDYIKKSQSANQKGAAESKDRNFLQQVQNVSPFIPKYELQNLLLSWQDVQKGVSDDDFVPAVIDRLNKVIINMPHTYQTDKIPFDQKMVHLHYFFGGSDWWIIEKDKGSKSDKVPGLQHQMFGYAVLNGDWQNSELGYISMPELESTGLVELDLYFQPQLLTNALRKAGHPEYQEEEKPIVTKGNVNITEGSSRVVAAQNTIDGVDYILYKHTGDNGGTIKVYDKEAEEVVSITKFDDFLKAKAKYDITLFNVDGKTQTDRDIEELNQIQEAWDDPENQQVLQGEREYEEQRELEDIVKQSGAPAGNVVIGAVPKYDFVEPEATTDLGFPAGKVFANNTSTKGLNQYEINEKIRLLVDKRGTDPEAYNDADLELLEKYEGSGGFSKQGETGARLLDQFFTPDHIIQKMWGLAFKHGFTFEKASICEPSVGIGRFLKYIPAQLGVTQHVLTFEIDEIAHKICKILYPHFEHRFDSFETLFFAKNKKQHLGLLGLPYQFDLVIGNPPYREYISPYSPLGEREASGANTFDQYFLMRGVDILKPNGLLIFIVPSSFMANDNKYNDFKNKLAGKCDLIDAYRLPSGLFDATEVTTDILVLRKKATAKAMFADGGEIQSVDFESANHGAVKAFPTAWAPDTYAYVVPDEFNSTMWQILVQHKDSPPTPPIGDIGDPFGGTREEIEELARRYASDTLEEFADGGEISTHPRQVGDVVKWIEPLEDEVDETYTVKEINVAQNWCLIEANVNMNIKPTTATNISSLEIVVDRYAGGGKIKGMPSEKKIPGKRMKSFGTEEYGNVVFHAAPRYSNAPSVFILNKGKNFSAIAMYIGKGAIELVKDVPLRDAIAHASAVMIVHNQDYKNQDAYGPMMQADFSKVDIANINYKADGSKMKTFAKGGIVIGKTTSGKDVLEMYSAYPREYDHQHLLDAAQIHSAYGRKAKNEKKKQLALEYAAAFRSEAMMNNMTDALSKFANGGEVKGEWRKEKIKNKLFEKGEGFAYWYGEEFIGFISEREDGTQWDVWWNQIEDPTKENVVKFLNECRKGQHDTEGVGTAMDSFAEAEEELKEFANTPAAKPDFSDSPNLSVNLKGMYDKWTKKKITHKYFPGKAFAFYKNGNFVGFVYELAKGQFFTWEVTIEGDINKFLTKSMKGDGTEGVSGGMYKSFKEAEEEIKRPMPDSGRPHRYAKGGEVAGNYEEFADGGEVRTSWMHTKDEFKKRKFERKGYWLFSDVFGHGEKDKPGYVVGTSLPSNTMKKSEAIEWAYYDELKRAFGQEYAIDKKIGGHKVRNYIIKDSVKEALEKGLITQGRLREILDSAGLDYPEYLK